MFASSGLGIDETYTVATSRYFGLSYFDHPPMAWWMSWAMQSLTNSDAPILVRLPFIFISALAIWRMYQLTEVLFGEKAAVAASFIFTITPALGVTSATWVLPDGPLIYALLTAAYYLAQLFFGVEQKPWLWLAAGFWGGIAMLSKYHGIFLFAGVAMFVLTTRAQHQWLQRPWPYLGAMLGLLIFSPVLIWNAENNWISFSFQSGRTGTPQLHLLRPLATLAGQALYLLPWIWLGIIIATFTALSSGASNSQRWLILCLGLPLVILFVIISAISSSAVLFHWAMPGYLLLIPLLGEWISQKINVHYTLLKRLSLTSASLILALIAAVTLIWFVPALSDGLALNRDLLQDMRSFEDINSYLSEHGISDEAGVIIAPTKWFLSGKFDYALKGRFVVTCFCADPRQYGLNAPLNRLVGQNFLIPIEMGSAQNEEQMLLRNFERVIRLDNLIIHSHGKSIEEFQIYYAEKFHENYIREKF